MIITNSHPQMMIKSNLKSIRISNLVRINQSKEIGQLRNKYKVIEVERNFNNSISKGITRIIETKQHRKIRLPQSI